MRQHVRVVAGRGLRRLARPPRVGRRWRQRRWRRPGRRGRVRRRPAGGRRQGRVHRQRLRLLPHPRGRRDQGTVGPSLDEITDAEALTSGSRSRTRTPRWSAGYPRNVMPDDFGDELSQASSTRWSSTFWRRSNDADARLFAPGWYRAALGVALGFAVGTGIVVAVRAALRLGPALRLGRDHHRRRPGRRPVRLPGRNRLLRLLVPLGLGAPTVPEDHSGHGACSWKDYFRSTPITR